MTSRLVRPFSLLTVAALVAGAGAATAQLPAPGPVPAVRPGPAVLYAPAPDAPQLQNTGLWEAGPILVSGAQAYREGEWLYQDFLNDDHGATGGKDNGDPFGTSAHLYSPTGGTFTYPTEPVYARNAADLVELRVRPLRGATAFRVTLNSLKDPARSAFTLALGSATAATAWPHGAGVKSPSKVFVTWHGKTAEVLDAATGKALGPASTQVDLTRRQISVTIPHATFNPGKGKLRTTVGAGLWDPAAGRYLAPKPGPASATVPGGGTPQGVAIVNVGPRFDEPMPKFVGTNMGDTAAAGIAAAPWWRDRNQSLALTRGDVTPFFADVDLAKAARRAIDDSGVPTTGPLNRILASHFSFGQGLDPTKVCFDLRSSFSAGAKCIGRFVGQLQSYALYVPKKKAPAKGYGMTLLLHSLSANYNQYLASKNQSQLGERGPGSLVLTPGGRGPDGFYAGIAEADTFEAWADVARHYPVDNDWASVSGYSMGGFGTYRLLARYPDLFSRGFSVVGAPGAVIDQLPSLRNTPLLTWNSAADELVNLKTSEDAYAANVEAGIRVEHDLFLTADHLTLAGNDEFAPGAAFLGTARVERNPSHVTFVVDPTEDNAQGTAVADHAYWLSGLKTRAKGNGTVDAVSSASGKKDAPVLAVTSGAGALTGGELPALPFASRSQQWGPVAKAARADVLTLTATNLRTITVDLARAGLTCRAKLAVTTDGPVELRLAGCGRTVRFR